MVKSILMLTACPLCLAIGTVATKAMVDHISLFILLAIQLFGSISFLWCIVFIKGTKYEVGEPITPLFVVGLIIGVGSIFTVLALKYIPASQAGLIFSSQPLLILLFAWLILKETSKLVFIYLGVIAVLGVVITISPGIGADDKILGSFFAILSTAFAAIYSVWMRKITSKQDSLISLSTLQTVALVVSIIALMVEYLFYSHQQYTEITLSNFLKIYIIGIVYYGAAFWFFLLGLKEVPTAGIAGLYLNLIPIFTIVLAYQFLGEKLVSIQWIGTLITLTSIAIISVMVAINDKNNPTNLSEASK